MNILYISQYFPPEMGAPAARVFELSRYWVQSGHRVTVLTGFPNHPTGVIHSKYKSAFRKLIKRETMDGISVVRTWLLPFPNRKAHERILNYFSFCLSASLTGSFLSRPDVIIATTPQIFVGLSGWWVSHIKKVPFILEVRDLWPDSITASGMGKEDSLSIKAIRALVKFLYRSSKAIVVVTPAFKEDLVSKWGVPPEKISIIENGVETDLFTPDGDRAVDKNSFGLEGRFVVSYIGTLGFAHGLNTVLQAADQLKDVLPDVTFLFVGEGADKERLVSQAKARRLSNVIFMPQQPREKVPSLIRASDVCLVMLRKAEVFKTVIPTKMLEFMSCGRPVVLGVDGQARKVLEEAKGGLFIEPEDANGLVETLVRLYQDGELRKSLGMNGRYYILNNLSRKKTSQDYLILLYNYCSTFSTS